MTATSMLETTHIHKLCCQCQHLLLVLGSCIEVSRKQSVLKVATFDQPVQQVEYVSSETIFRQCFV